MENVSVDEKFSIQPYLTDLAILEETVKQIQKDLSFFDLQISFSGNKNSAYNELLEQIQPQIKKLMDENYERFLSLLYRVDIHEKLMKNADPKLISELIIKRCLQKVVLRKFFSK